MRYASLAAAVGLLFTAGMATASTKVQGNVVDADPGSAGVSAKSKFKLDSKGNFQFGLKGITDSAGNPAAVTAPGGEYIAVIKGDAQGVQWELNALVAITKEGQAKVKGSAASLLSLVPLGTPVGVLGAEVHEPVTPAAAANCTTVMTVPPFPGVWVNGLSVGATNPCASGAKIGYSGVVTE